MTEPEWLQSRVGSDMLQFLAEDLPQSDRKMRLAACACSRRVQRFIGSSDFARLLHVVEESADDRSLMHERERRVDPLRRAWQMTVEGKSFLHASPADLACDSFLRSAEAPKDPSWNFPAYGGLHYAT